MKYIVIVLSFALFLSIYTTHRDRPTVVEVEHVEVTDPVAYNLARATGDHEENTCWFEDTALWDEKVFIVYPDESPDDDVIGTWDYDTRTIALMQPGGLDVQTVAHEVSHMVDDFMAQLPGVDPHYEAYMQGYWTECVWRILQYDIEETRSGKFRFNTQENG